MDVLDWLVTCGAYGSANCSPGPRSGPEHIAEGGCSEARRAEPADNHASVNSARNAGARRFASAHALAPCCGADVSTDYPGLRSQSLASPRALCSRLLRTRIRSALVIALAHWSIVHTRTIAGDARF